MSSQQPSPSASGSEEVDQRTDLVPSSSDYSYLQSPLAEDSSCPWCRCYPCQCDVKYEEWIDWQLEEAEG